MRDDLSFDEVLADQAADLFLFHVAVPGSFRVDHQIRSVAALSQAAAEGDPNLPLKMMRFKIFLKGLQRLFRPLLTAGRPGADKKMMKHVRSLMSPVYIIPAGECKRRSSSC